MSTESPEARERYVVVLVVDREVRSVEAALGGRVARPVDWDWPTLTGARTEVVASELIEPEESIRVAIDDDSWWLEIDDNDEVIW